MANRERAKLYMVIGLAVVFVLVGYFRFFHGKVALFKHPKGGVAIPAVVKVPTIVTKSLQPAAERQRMAPEGLRTRLRDIFAPVKPPATKFSSSAVAAVPLQPLPKLQLSGTIVGGTHPLAIINGHFLRRGDRIAGLEVVSITKDQVTLVGEGRQVMLNTLTGVEERSP
ncbi:MAG: general secretion pathway protein GspB [Syntrophales bacterium]|jgi:hypothetical protein|nr:general secretion pathway protein GspB [Syntrophales bacterium]